MRRILFTFVVMVLAASLTSPAFADETAEKLQRTRQLMAETTPAPPVAEPSLSGSTLRSVRGLAFTLGIFFIGVFAYRAWQRKKNPQSLNSPVLTRLKINASTEVMLVDIDGKRFVVAQSEKGTAICPYDVEGKNV